MHEDLDEKSRILKNGCQNEHASITHETKLGIIGYGNYGSALARRCRLAGQPVVVGSSRVREDSNSTTTYENVLNECEIVALCIPRHAYDDVVPKIWQKETTGKIIIDVSNLESTAEPSNALYLQSILPKNHVVKALNTVSAYSLESEAYGASRDTFVCGNDRQSREKVMQLLREIGLNPIDRGRLNSAVEIERLPLRFFEGWGTALIITGVVLAFCFLYVYLRFFWATGGKGKKQELIMYWANRVMGWVVLWNLALVYLPGILAGYIQLIWGTKYRAFPNWFDRWMKCRKQLGLLTFTLACMHMCLSAFAMGSHMIKYMFVNKPIPNSGGLVMKQGLTWNSEVSIIFATISLALMGIAAVTSLPSVGATMSWREWNFVQRGIGFTSLVTAFLHVMIYVYKLWDPNYQFGAKMWAACCNNMPPSAFIMPILPLIVIILKFILLIPGLSCYLDRIRQGKVNKEKGAESIALA